LTFNGLTLYNVNIMLTKLEKLIVSSIQGNIPVTKRPYLAIAEKLQISEEKLLDVLNDLCERGVMRRFGATLRHQKSGFTSNAMVAWEVDEDRINSVGEKMASFREVSHCYRRDPNGDWPYNLYTMIHARDEESCRNIAQSLSEATSATSYILLFSLQELKKTSMVYFPAET